MGLDAVELVMEIEEAFDITIPDGDAERIHTVGDLYRQVLCRRDAGGPGPCMSASAFYRLRRTLVEQRNLGRDEIRPDGLVQDLLPASDRRAAWSDLSGRLGWGLPPLVRPGWMRRTATVAPMLLWLPAYALTLLVIARHNLLAPPFGGTLVFVAALPTFAVALALMVAAEWLTQRYAVLLPATCRTVRGLVGESLRLNYGTIVQQMGEPKTDPAVWERVRSIVCTQLGVAPDLITDETSFHDFL